jgi:hypothetical protein
MPQPSSVTELLVRADAGDAGAQAELYAVAEPVLRALARARERARGAARELETTALIDDAFLKLVEQGVTTWAPGDREKFFAYVSAKMHDLLIDELRHRGRGLGFPAQPEGEAGPAPGPGPGRGDHLPDQLSPVLHVRRDRRAARGPEPLGRRQALWEGPLLAAQGAEGL